jgi:hypothetical protein
VAEDAADLDDVELDVDDQVAREGLAGVVEAQAPTVAIEACIDGRRMRPLVARQSTAGMRNV